MVYFVLVDLVVMILFYSSVNHVPAVGIGSETYCRRHFQYDLCWQYPYY
jgi:hypothetical protein